jgi:hypothetical protein
MILSHKRACSLSRRLFAALLIFALAPELLAQRTKARGSRSRASAQAAAAPAKSFTNPVFDTDFPDPTVMRASDGW